jgi:quinol monooxygenase YgiN
MQKKGLTVKGVPEVTRALDKVDRGVSNLQEAHREAASSMLPDIVNATRNDTGTLAAGWQADSTDKEAQFINEEEYAGVQEWGWQDHNIEPTHAILEAFEKNAKETEELYSEHIARIGERANFAVKD